MIRAFVGSGGKTGTIMKQAAAYRGEGKRVLITTSTQMGAREGTIIGDEAQPIIERLEREGFVMAGTKANREGKMAALSDKTFREAAAHADIVLVEADGSRQHPLKFPNATEPVIPEGTDEIFIICGLSAIGKPAKDVCHRLELVKAAIGIEEDTIITGEHVRDLVKKAYLEPLSVKYPEAKLVLYPCQRDTLYLRAVAALLQADMDPSMIDEKWFCSVAVYGNASFVLEIVTQSPNGSRIGAMTIAQEKGILKPQFSQREDETVLLLPLERWEKR